MSLFFDLRHVLHMDLDSFFVSVERQNDSRLLNKPVIIGGSTDRGVVASCSYEARVFGVHSSMPMKLALRLCPAAIVRYGDFDAYSKKSREVTQIIREQVPILEKASIDEFYIDLTGMDRYHGCSKFSAELKSKVIHESGLPISYALASNKMISKVGTNEHKPNAQFELEFGLEKGFLAPLDVNKMPGIGEKTSILLNQMGVRKIRTLSEIPLPMMESRFGKLGIELHRKANGIDETPVIPYTERKSIGTQETFENDTIDVHFLYSRLVKMTEQVTFHLRQKKKLCGCVSVKLRYADFNTESIQKIITYTSADHVILDVAKELFKKIYDRRLLVRMLGVKLSHLVQGHYQIDLFNDTVENVRLYQAMDHIRMRFGDQAVKRAIAMVEEETPHHL